MRFYISNILRFFIHVIYQFQQTKHRELAEKKTTSNRSMSPPFSFLIFFSSQL